MADLPDNPNLPEVDDADRIVGLISRLPHGSVVRRLSLQVVQGRKLESVQPFRTSLMTPHPKRWRERIAAAWALGRTGTAAEERDAVVQLLFDVVEGGHREPLWSKLRRAALHTTAGAFILFSLINMTDGPRYYSGFDVFMFLMMLHCFVGLFAVPMVQNQETSTTNLIRAEAAESLGRLGSVEAIGTLAAALKDRSEPVRAAAAESLHALLPLVTPEHYGTLGAPTMESLGAALSHPDGQLVFKILSALESAGTAAAIPYVERAYRRGRTHRVREAAEVVLKVLAERKLRETERDRLLRPTLGLHDPSLLLRSPSAAAEDPALLLQPASDQG